jgi:hypothetical protein
MEHGLNVLGGQTIVTIAGRLRGVGQGWIGLDRVGFCHVATQGLSPETLDMAFMCCWLVGACGRCSKAGDAQFGNCPMQIVCVDAQMNSLEMNR